jgi:hypothetical protein
MAGKCIPAAAVGLFLFALGTTAPVWADNGRLRIPRADCLALVPHQPAPDVAYRPGVDVRGRPVAPADLPGSTLQVEVPDQVEFEVSFSPLRGAAGGRFGDTELYVGTVRYNLKTGEATLNGVPLSDPQKAEIAARCREVLGRP